MPKGIIIDRQLMLKNIQENLQRFKEWSESPDWLDHQLRYYYHLEAFTELMEEYYCGSTGGFGNGQPEDQNLLERAEWLLSKYNLRAKK